MGLLLAPLRDALDLYERIVECRAAAHVRQRLRSQLVDVCASGRKLVPPDGGRDDDAGTRTRRDDRTQFARAAFVEGAHSLAVLYSTRGGVIGMNLYER